MFFGSVPFSAAAFADPGVEITNVTINASGQSLSLTLSNDYIVQKIHFVNGNSLTSAVGTITPEIRIHEAITGLQADLSTNTPTISADANLTLSGTSFSATLGTSQNIVTEFLNGNAATLSTNTPTVSGASNFSVTGTSLTSAVNTPTVNADANVLLSGQSINVSLGSTGQFVNVILNGNSITSAVNSVGIGYALGVTGQALTSAVGSITGSVQTTLTGQQINLSVNNVTVDAQQNVTLTVSGNAISSAVNSVAGSIIAGVSGTSMALATSGAQQINLSQTITPATNLATIATNNVSVFTFSDVNDTTTATIPATPVSTSGAGGGSYSEVSTTGAGNIDEREVA